MLNPLMELVPSNSNVCHGDRLVGDRKGISFQGAFFSKSILEAVIGKY